MSEKQPQPLDIPSQTSTPKVPEIYTLISSGATAAEIGMQLYKDFSMDHNPEKAYLAIKELLDRGHEGRAMLLQMTHGSDELSTKIAEICKIDLPSEEEVEKVLGVKRFGDVINNDDQVISNSYPYFLRTGLTSLDRNSFETKLRWEEMILTDDARHLDGTIEDSTLVYEYTFAVSEPGYLELFNPKDLIKLRTLSDQNMLLLGSYGPYSAREFRKYADKITNNAETYVIDIDRLCVNQMLADRKSKNHVVEGDARNMPFRDSSMDQIYTNHLFHFLDGEQFKKNPDTDILEIFKEASRVLKPGGFFVISEKPFGEHRSKKDEHQMIYEVILIAKKFGLEAVQFSTLSLAHCIRSEVGNASIDENGFPHYENSLISADRDKAIRVRFVKKA